MNRSKTRKIGLLYRRDAKDVYIWHLGAERGAEEFEEACRFGDIIQSDPSHKQEAFELRDIKRRAATAVTKRNSNSSRGVQDETMAMTHFGPE